MTEQKTSEFDAQTESEPAQNPVDEQEGGEATPDEATRAEQEAKLEAQLDRIYKKIPLIFDRLRGDALDSDLLVSVKKLLHLLDHINEIELSLLPVEERQAYKPLNMSRIYEMASQSGGMDEGQLEELRQANEALGKENEELIKFIELQTAANDTLKKKAADEILERKGMGPFRAAEFHQPLQRVRQFLDRLEKTLAELPLSSEKSEGLDALFLKKIAGLEEISPDILEATPERHTFFGRFLNKFGMAYDPKDMLALRKFIVMLLKVNGAVYDVQSNVQDLQVHLSNMQELVILTELYAGHDERQSPQYQEALQQIGRLQETLDSYAEKNGLLHELNQQIKERQKKVKATQKELTALNSEIFSGHITLSRLRDEIERTKNRKEQNPEQQTGKKQPAKPEKDTATPDKSDESDGASLKKLQNENGKLSYQIMELKAQIAEHKQALEREKLEREQERHKANNRLRNAKNGPWVEKQANEIGQLRIRLIEEENKATQERAAAQAMETRLMEWVREKPALEKGLSAWKKRAMLKFSFVTAACLTTGALCYALGTYVGSTLATGVWQYAFFPVLTCTGISAFVGPGLLQRTNLNKPQKIITGAMFGSIIGITAVISSYATQTNLINRHAAEENAKIQAAYQQLQGFTNVNDGSTPWCVWKDPCTNERRVQTLPEKYAGQLFLADFTDPSHPTITVIPATEKVELKPVRPPQQTTPDAQPAANAQTPQASTTPH